MRAIPLLILLALAGTALAQTNKAIQDITQTDTVAPSNHFLMLKNQHLGTGASVWLVDASNLLESLKGFLNWPLAGGSGLITNENTLFLREDGDDATALRGRLDKPYRTLSNAVYNLQSGDTLIVYPGTYTHLVVSNGTAMANPPGYIGWKTNVSIIGLGKPRIVCTNSAFGDAFYVNGCTNILFDGLVLIGKPNPFAGSLAGQYLGIAIDLGAAPNAEIEVRNCEFRHWARFGIVNYSPTAGHDRLLRFHHNLFYDIGTTNLGGSPTYDGAAIVVEANDVSIYDNAFIKGFRGVEIYNHAGAVDITNCAISRNLFYAQVGRSILSVPASFSSTNTAYIKIDNNVFRDDLQGPPHTDEGCINILNTACVDILDNWFIGITNGYASEAMVLVTASQEGARDYKLQGNKFRDIRGCVAIEIAGTGGTSIEHLQDVLLQNNDFEAIGETAVTVCANHVTISGNSFKDIWKDPGDLPAIWLRGSWYNGVGTNCQIYGNRFRDTDGTVSMVPAIRVDAGYVGVVAWDNDVGPGIQALANYAGTNVLWGIGPSNNVMQLPAATYDPAHAWMQSYVWNSNVAVRVPAPVYALEFAIGDETTAITAGTGKLTFRMPYAFTVKGVRASLSTAQATGNIFTVDVNEGGTSILGTKLTIDNTERTSTTAAAACTITDSALADDAEMTVDVDQIGDSTAKGLKITLIGTR